MYVAQWYIVRLPGEQEVMGSVGLLSLPFSSTYLTLAGIVVSFAMPLPFVCCSNQFCGQCSLVCMYVHT